MKIEIDGKEVEIDNAAALAALKDAPEYNAELDRMRVKGEESTRTALTGELTAVQQAAKAAQAELEAAHAKALEAATQASSGEANEVIQGLKTQIQTITESFTKSEQDRAQLAKDNARTATQSELTLALSLVDDPYHKKNIARDAMDAFDTETGQFKLATGIMGGIDEMVAEMQAVHPDKFLSEQKGGAGVTGGNGTVIVPNKPYNQMSVPEKTAYLEQNKRK